MEEEEERGRRRRTGRRRRDRVAPCDLDPAAAAERWRNLDYYFASFLNVPLRMNAASVYVPKDNPQKPMGEDAHFVSPEKQTIAVADGVGGWAKHGIDSGEYARQLMTYSLIALENEPAGLVNPKRVLTEAYRNASAEGSSTACIIALSGNKLRAANVGDSGFLIIRNGAVAYRSPVQQRGFNVPYQLGTTRDDPRVAEEIEVAVMEGDVVVAGTDGLLDNVFEGEIAAVAGDPSVWEENGPENRALCMANVALCNSFDRFRDSPFAVAARKAGRYHSGGKVDDITVIVARIELDSRV